MTNMNEMSDEQLIARSLIIWANYIETGDMSMSALDAKNAKLTFNALHVDQMKLIIRLRDLADNFK